MASAVKKTDAVTVGVRIRPMNDKEVSSSTQCFFTASADATNVQELDETGAIQKNWPYDHVFGPDCSNQYIFQTVGVKLVDVALEGYNTVMFMYGQTASGKTFTLFGGGQTTGVIGHAMEYVYDKVMSSSDSEYVIKMQYAELYNEELKDLLSSQPNENLKIIDDPHVGPTIQNITEASFTNPTQIQRLLEEGEKSRHFGVTNMNMHSSRSHVLVRLSIELRKVGYKPSHPLRTSWGKDKPTCLSTLNLVDLAGSERAGKSGTSGQSLKEGSFINKSLLTLGTVISNLSEGKSGQHVPYRNSKLTRLLASALGGNAKTCMITCISPSSFNVGESLSTLRFASRAKRIVNIVHKNELQDVKTLSSKLATQTAEIDFLRNQLEISRQLGFNGDGEDQAESLKSKAASARKHIRVLKFLMIKIPKCAAIFKRGGHAHLAKKVQDDLRGVISGTKDPAEILEEIGTLIQAHLPSEKTLIAEFHDIEAANTAEELGEFVEEAVDLRIREDEVFVGLDFGSETLTEQLECSRMAMEDFRVYSATLVSALETLLHKRGDSEASKTKSLQELSRSAQQQHDQITRLQQSESSLLRTIDELKAKLELEHKASLANNSSIQSRFQAFENTITAKSEQIIELQHGINAREGECQRQKSQIDALNKELAAHIASRRQYEEDSIRARNEMKTQMDKIRATMTHMLQQGGERSKVIEDQNDSLQNEVDDLKDKLDTEKAKKSRLEKEISQLRFEIQRQCESEKVHIQELGFSQEQNSKLSHRINGLRYELTHMTTLKETADQINEEQRTKDSDQIRILNATLDEKEAELKELHMQLTSTTFSLQAEVEAKSREVRNLQDELDAVHLAKQKLIQSFAQDMSRMEKKLAHQAKLQDELTAGHNTQIQNSRTASRKYQDEIRFLKNKIIELQSQVEQIEDFIEDQLDGREEYADDDDDSRSVESAADGRYTGGATPTPTPGKKRYSLKFSPAHVSTSNSFRSELGINDLVINTNPAFGSSIATFSPKMGYHPPGSEVDRRRAGSQRMLPISPVGRGDIDPLVLPPPPTSSIADLEDSEDFLRIRDGFKLAQISMQHAIREERLIRDLMLSSIQQWGQSHREVDGSVAVLEAQVSALTASNKDMHDSLVLLRRKEQDAVACVAELEKKLSGLKTELFDMTTREGSAKGLLDEFERQRAFVGLQLASAREEKDRLHQQCAAMSQAHRSLELKLDEIFEEKSLLESRADLLEQDLCVLQAERDELVKRFIPLSNAKTQFDRGSKFL